MQNILYIDTSGKCGGVALAIEGQDLAVKFNENEREYAATIHSAIEELLQSKQLKLQAINAVAVVGGPGSYTGLRIGLATAKGICYALQIPLLLYNKLDLMALDTLQTAAAADYFLVKLPARTEEYFICLYDKQGNNVIPARHISANELENVIHPYKNLLEITEEKPLLASDSWHRMTMEDLKNNRTTSLAESVPLYLKEAYTTQPKKE